MRHKVLSIVLVLIMLMTSFVIGEEVVKGPYVDKVFVNIRTQEEIGLKDAAEGLTDIFFWGVDGSTFFGLDNDTVSKLEVYNIPSGSWSLLLNPIPNAAPYQWEREGVTYFNPFAIKDVRFAINFLINRKYMVDEILNGAGSPMFDAFTPGQPGVYKYNLLGNEFGFTPEGNETKALKDIEDAMNAAAKLPENAGRLKKGDKYWEFDGEPVTIKFCIRVDDPNGRLRQGHYVSDQLEKAGFMVERLLWDRARCSDVVYFGDPADYAWHMYTEGWGAGATRKWWTVSVAQMYAPFFSNMPGYQDPNFWNYTNDAIDDLTLAAWNGQFLSTQEYWDLVLPASRMGLQEAVRIYTCSQDQFFAANKERFNKRFAYGLGDGLNRWSLITANTPDKELKITEYSARGALFMSSWNPVGTQGFNDTYSIVLAAPCYDAASFESPVSADTIPYKANWDNEDIVIKARRVGEEIVGDIPVPSNALRYDTVQDKWVEVGDGLTCTSKCTFTFNFSNAHHGMRQGIVDLLYFQAFIEEWARNDGETDPEFDAGYSAFWLDTLETIKGWEVDMDAETITVYFNYNFPPDLPRVAARGAPGFTVIGSSKNVGVIWEIDEALKLIVLEDNASGTPYSFSAASENEVDVLVPEIVADIRAKLVEMKERGHVPESIKEYMTVEQAKAAYEATIKFIDEHGHAFISNGPFYINKYVPEDSYIELAAFRDESYPFTADHWMETFAVPRLAIRKVNMSALLPRGKDFEVTVKASQIIFPETTTLPADNGEVEVKILAEEEISAKAQVTNTGEFKVVIPGSETANLEPGTYNVLIIASMEGGVPASMSKSIVVW